MGHEDTPDAALVAACLGGDATAWETIVRRFRRLVYSVPMRMGLRPEEADEVFQETYATLLEKLGQVRDRERIGLWLAVTARRKALDRVRRRPAREAELPEGYDAPDPGDLPVDELVRLERQARVRAAVERLSARCRALLAALYLDDPPLAYKDAARKLGMPQGSLGPTRMRCFEKLRQELAEDDA